MRVVVALLTVLVLALPVAHAQETPRMGGVLKVATIGEPPTLDIPMSTATQVFEIMWHVNEGLFTYDRSWNPIPHLAESYTLIAVAVLNHKAGLMTNKKMRQALQATLDMEPIMAAGFGHKDFIRLDPSIFFPEQPWHSTVAATLYNQHDRDKARRLLKEAGYARQPVRWATTKEYEFMYKNALVAKQQMEDVGFVVDLQVVDWATLNARAEKPELWEIASTGFVFSADPANHVAFRCTFWGAWCNEDKERLVADLRAESDPKKRKAIVERLQAIFYDDVGHVKLGDYFTLDAARRELRGEFRTAPRMYFWNSWLAK